MHPKKLEKNRVPLERAPKIVGVSRNAFGTRLCQRIECSRCNKVDYVSRMIKGAKIKYCRECAERLLETFEAGRFIAEKQVKRQCAQCQCEFLVSQMVANKKEELRCNDCFRGFEVWRGKVSTPGDEKESKRIIIKSGSKTLIRKIIHETI